MDSRCVRDLLQVMSELTMAQRRDFLQFVTGSPKLPIGGKLISSTIVAKTERILITLCRFQGPYPNVHSGP